MSLADVLPAVNATLNGTCAVLLLAGRVAIAKKRPEVHRRLMVTAFTVSCVFLVSYLVRVSLSGTHRYPGSGLAKAAYLFVLSTHMLLAMAVVPLVLTALWHGYKRQLEKHRRVARWTFPVWLYVSVTGVLVYLMLFQWAPHG
jgi:putative membrane protein